MAMPEKYEGNTSVTATASGIGEAVIRKLVAAGYSEETVWAFKKDQLLLAGDGVESAMLYIVNQPSHVHIGNMVVFPARQEYPHVVGEFRFTKRGFRPARPDGCAGQR